jgi:sortase A
MAALILIVAAAVLSYPYWSRWYAGSMQAVVMQEYEDSVDVLTPDKIEQCWQEALAYNERMAAGELADELGLMLGDPFSGGLEQTPRGYGTMLNVSGGREIMAVIEVLKLGLKLPVYHGVEEQVLQQGVGHVPQTALPVGGTGTHCVLAGHRGLPRSLLFTDLDKVEKGDQFLLRVLDHTLAYEVDNISVVEPDNISSLAAQPGKDLVTLATCTPLGINSHRLLIRGHRVPYVPAPPVWPDSNMRQLLVALGIVLTALVLLAIVYWNRRRQRRKLREARALQAAKAVREMWETHAARESTGSHL